MDQQHDSVSMRNSLCQEPSQTVAIPAVVKNVPAGITPPPELRVRQNDCQQIQNSADQAVRQASQQAAESVRQASESMRQVTQQAQQSADQASRSATEAIRQATQSASQSIAAASRSASQALSSASSVVASVQSSASAAISRANESAQLAQGAQSTAQVRCIRQLDHKKAMTDFNFRALHQWQYFRQELLWQRQQVRIVSGGSYKAARF